MYFADVDSSLALEKVRSGEVVLFAYDSNTSPGRLANQRVTFLAGSMMSQVLLVDVAEPSERIMQFLVSLGVSKTPQLRWFDHARRVTHSYVGVSEPSIRLLLTKAGLCSL